ncbi:MAG: isoprenylcysteine carboxylmethyltransferase family protein [Promethearchaeota archaeon]|nr:MAG: isoprenylcysteine carboxylmethyltransferase family protein [Candidatus Lokiarchaeota archaeon]
MEKFSKSKKRFLIVQLPNYSFFLVFVISIALTWLIDWIPWILLPGSDITHVWRLIELVFGYMGTILAAMFITWGTVTLSRERASGREIGKKANDTALISDGAYSYCRHPITLGFLFAISSIFLIFDFVPFLLTAIIYTPILLGLLIYEERELIERFGDAYLQYKKKTRFLIPIKRRT